MFVHLIVDLLVFCSLTWFSPKGVSDKKVALLTAKPADNGHNLVQCDQASYLVSSICKIDGDKNTEYVRISGFFNIWNKVAANLRIFACFLLLFTNNNCVSMGGRRNNFAKRTNQIVQSTPF